MVALAALGACDRPPTPEVDLAPRPPEPAAALVNGAPVASEPFESLPVVGEADGAASAVEAAIVEELVVQDAERRGLLDGDEAIFALRVRHVERRLQEAAAGVEISERALRREFNRRLRERRDEGRVRVGLWFYRAGADPDGARARAERAEKAIAGGAAFATAGGEADRPLAPVPSGAVSPKDLRTLWGTAVAERVAALDAGETSEPIEVPGGLALVHLIERVPNPPPTFESQRVAVEEALRREVRARARARLLDALRTRLPVEILPIASSTTTPVATSRPSAILDSLAAEVPPVQFDPKAGPVVARVAGAAVHQGAVDAFVGRTFRSDAGRFASAEERRAALDEIVEAELLARGAAETGLGRYDRVYRARAAALAVADALGTDVGGQVELGPQEVARLRAWIDGLRRGARIERRASDSKG